MLSSAQPRVLLVEDDPSVCQVLSQGLMHISSRQPLSIAAEVASAHSVASALELLGGHQDQTRPAWDVVLMDMNLGEQTSLDLLQEMRTHSPEQTCATSWILLTGRASAELHIQAIRLGVDAVLLKPVSLAALREAVGQGFAKAVERRSGIHRLRELDATLTATSS